MISELTFALHHTRTRFRKDELYSLHKKEYSTKTQSYGKERLNKSILSEQRRITDQCLHESRNVSVETKKNVYTYKNSAYQIYQINC